MMMVGFPLRIAKDATRVGPRLYGKVVELSPIGGNPVARWRDSQYLSDRTFAFVLPNSAYSIADQLILMVMPIR